MAMKFDDIVEEGSNKWTQVCEEHMNQAIDENLGVLSENAIGVTCGCEGCKKEAMYYLDFNE
jgi:hypothetical protein